MIKIDETLDKLDIKKIAAGVINSTLDTLEYDKSIYTENFSVVGEEPLETPTSRHIAVDFDTEEMARTIINLG